MAAINVGAPVKVSELLAKPAKAGRQPSPIDLALIDLVKEAGEEKNAENAFPWDFSPIKPLTARAQATRAIERAEMNDSVYVSARDGKLWFSQVPLRAKKK